MESVFVMMYGFHPLVISSRCGGGRLGLIYRLSLSCDFFWVSRTLVFKVCVLFCLEFC